MDDEYCEGNLENYLNFYYKYLPEGLNKPPENIKKSIYEIKKRFKPYFTAPNAGEKKLSVWIKHKMSKTLVNGNSYLWLLKPSGLNRGRGIHIFNSLAQLEKLIIDYSEGYVEKSYEEIRKELYEKNKPKIEPEPKKEKLENIFKENQDDSEKERQIKEFFRNKVSNIINV